MYVCMYYYYCYYYYLNVPQIRLPIECYLSKFINDRREKRRLPEAGLGPGLAMWYITGMICYKSYVLVWQIANEWYSIRMEGRGPCGGHLCASRHSRLRPLSVSIRLYYVMSLSSLAASVL